MPETELQQLLRNLVKSPDNRCFACGPRNPVGLHLHVEQREGAAHTRFVPGEWHQGWEGVVHGGILAALLDEVMAYCLYFNGVKGVTARMELRYRAPVRQGDELLADARMTRQARQIVDVEGRITREGQLVAEASARFMKLGELDAEPLRL